MPDLRPAALKRTPRTGRGQACGITAQSVDPMAATIDSPDARLRAAVAGAMLMGIASQRYILKMPDLKDADVEDILGLITPLIQSLLSPDTAK